MTEKEWLAMGYNNGIIEHVIGDVPLFSDIYKKWMKYKSGQIKGQSLDRMECTYNKYYSDSSLVSLHINDIGEDTVIDFFKWYLCDVWSCNTKGIPPDISDCK